MDTIHTYVPSSGHRLRHDPFLAILGPRPIGWISSRDKEGRINLAPYSFFNAFCDEPPIIGFCSYGWKDTVSNISETREFVWNLASRHIAEGMNATSASVPHEVDEFTISGLTKIPGEFVDVPRVRESLVSFECKLTQIIQLQDVNGDKTNGWMTFGEVIAIHIDKSVIVEGVYQTAMAHPILRAGGAGDYVEVRQDAMFAMSSPN